MAGTLFFRESATFEAVFVAGNCFLATPSTETRDFVDGKRTCCEQAERTTMLLLREPRQAGRGEQTECMEAKDPYL